MVNTGDTRVCCLVVHARAFGLTQRMRHMQVAGAPMGNGKMGGMGGLGGLKLGGNGNKFERFDDGLQMSESTRRMEGFGSGR